MNALLTRIESILSQRTVAWRVALLLRGVVVTLVLLALVFAGSYFINNGAQRDDKELNAFASSVKQLQISQLQARRHEKDFYLRKDIQYLAQHKATMADIFAKLGVIEQQAPSDAVRDALPKLKKSFTAYQDAFDSAAASLQVAGLNEESGLHGKMRGTIRLLETQIKDATTLEVSMLTLRRHEKDFIQRETNDYIKRHQTERSKFLDQLARTKLSPELKDNYGILLNSYGEAFDAFATALLAAREAAKVARDAAHDTEPLMANLGTAADEIFATNTARNNTLQIGATVTFAVALLLLGSALTFLTLILARSIRKPLVHLGDTLGRLAAGDVDARSTMKDPDELGDLGRALDQMLDERIAAQRVIEKENEQLNDSVLGLLRAVAVLSKRDLTTKIPVAEDVTGAVSDALNLMTTETVKVLKQVTDFSADVTTASMNVKQQSDAVMGLAEIGRIEVEATSVSLGEAAEAMNQISQMAQLCNTAADKAIETTKAAQNTVATTVTGINATRETIRETEKRIKRLGERSQEISLAVNLIGTIAERTHILALNASMHAASAGEAGRGFGVVADEVQRLAENARQATQQIASLVNNIQADTAETVTAMNTAIEQVVTGSRLAERAGEQMEITAQTTTDLVRSVQDIAVASDRQAKSSRDLLTRADLIRSSTQETNDKLREQSVQTSNLVEYARGLLGAVRVFKLPS